jgi:hypothetical protein
MGVKANVSDKGPNRPDLFFSGEKEYFAREPGSPARDCAGFSPIGPNNGDSSSVFVLQKSSSALGRRRTIIAGKER